MHENDESPAKRKKKTRIAYRDGALPIAQRTLPSHCDLGDWIAYQDGRIARVTCFLGAAPFGRFRGPDGAEGPLTALPHAPIRRVDAP